ncbi:DUF1906 domain-containing protein [Streptomyces sp. NBC_01476]|uniref:DUF1906 domain-containing protein n=1 Tax=Streptomyces sp. NBC_01476 TaxID=2903881 RepID=UPI002E32E54A|nr:DUF1906 domain-containing protein [Streptomyces sp. NBC_01476]
MLIRYVLTGAFALTGLSFPTAPAQAQAQTQAQAQPQARAQAPAPARTAPSSHRAPTRVFSGQGFDTCQAPDLATMDAWREHSSYRAVGIYFGGRARACSAQTYLTPDWVRQTTGSGWNLLPIYVGSQSPCVAGSNKNPYRIDTENPSAQGTSEGADATGAAKALGLDPGSPLYLDMEAYDIGDTACTAATLTFVQAWDRQVRADGYLSGFYSSADSGVAHLENARRAGAGDLPDVIWFARWGVPANLAGEPSLAAGAWTPHARIHQYHGSITETYGGKALTIDRDLIDAPVAVVS